MKKKKMRTYQQRQDRTGYMFMAPWILGFALFTLFPFVFTIYLSFTNVKKTTLGYEIDFTGISNYIEAFVKNTEFLPALLEYLKMIVPYTCIVVVLSFIIAYLLCKIKTGKGILRTIYFLPVVIMSGPVMTQILAVENAAETAAEQVSEAVMKTNAYSNIFIMQIIHSRHWRQGLQTYLTSYPLFSGLPVFRLYCLSTVYRKLIQAFMKRQKLTPPMLGRLCGRLQYQC